MDNLQNSALYHIAQLNHYNQNINRLTFIGIKHIRGLPQHRPGPYFPIKIKLNTVAEHE